MNPEKEMASPADRLSETIRALFADALPKYVPASPSIFLGLVVTTVVVVASIAYAAVDRSRAKDGVFDRYRWVVIVLVGVAVGAKLGDYVQEKHYTISCIRENRQHYANVHWLRLYMRAWREVAGA